MHGPGQEHAGNSGLQSGSAGTDDFHDRMPERNDWIMAADDHDDTLGAARLHAYYRAVAGIGASRRLRGGVPIRTSGVDSADCLPGRYERIVDTDDDLRGRCCAGMHGFVDISADRCMYSHPGRRHRPANVADGCRHR